jgi:hypothetical protein
MPPADATICPILAAGGTAAMGIVRSSRRDADPRGYDAYPRGYIDAADDSPHLSALCMENRGFVCAFRRNGLCPPPKEAPDAPR